MTDRETIEHLIDKHDDLINTKQVAEVLGLTTRKAWELMTRLELQGYCCKYGYRVKGGWADPEFPMGQKRNGLYWQLYLKD